MEKNYDDATEWKRELSNKAKLMKTRLHTRRGRTLIRRVWGKVHSLALSHPKCPAPGYALWILALTLHKLKLQSTHIINKHEILLHL